jgi:two-component system, NtrC family, nitrogen regulation response regulator GlnG
MEHYCSPSGPDTLEDKPMDPYQLLMVIYYLDDCKDDYYLLKKAFQMRGHNVDLRYFSDPTKFKAEILKNRSAIDLILTDMNMPGENGLDIIDWYCDEYLQIPIAILSGGRDQTEVPRLLRAGVYLFKPFLLDHYKQLADDLVNSYGPLTCPSDPMELST